MDNKTGLDDVDLPGRDLQGTIFSLDGANNMNQNKHVKHAGSVELNIHSFSPAQNIVQLRKRSG